MPQPGKPKDSLAKLTLAETQAFRQWINATRLVAERRNDARTCDANEMPERKALLQMATAAEAAAFGHWQNICDALDEIEIYRQQRNNHQQP
jgi:hypothetical protein